MTVAKVRLTIQDMTWEKCVSRVESALKSLYGVKDVTASIVQSGVGEAEVVYVPAEISLEDLKECIASASGEKHDFKVIAVKEEGIKGGTG